MCHISFVDAGQFGVDIFFCISGFLVMYTTNKKGVSNKGFLLKKLLKILPLYYLLTLITYVLASLKPELFYTTEAVVINLIKSLIFIPYEVNGVIMPVLPIGWFINQTIELYIIFYLAMKINFKYRGVICAIIILILVGVGLVFDISFIPLKFWTNSVLLEFIFGILVFYFYTWLTKKEQVAANHSLLINILGLGMMSVLIGFMFWIDFHNFRINRVFSFGIPAFLLLVIFTCLFASLNLKNKLFKFFYFIGNISFSLYLTHYFVIKFYERIIFPLDNVSFKSCLFANVAVLFAIVIANITYELFEKRLGRLISKKL